MPHRKNREWILLADRAHAKFFIHDRADGRMEEIFVLADPAALERQHEMGTDRPGRGHGSSSSAGHAYEDHADFPEQESASFLRSIAGEINRAVQADKMDKLILVALPKTLAVINSALDDGAKALVTAEYAKNLIGVDPSTLGERLAKMKA